jgi:hypothetical protein
LLLVVVVLHLQLCKVGLQLSMCSGPTPTQQRPLLLLLLLLGSTEGVPQSKVPHAQLQLNSSSSGSSNAAGHVLLLPELQHAATATSCQHYCCCCCCWRCRILLLLTPPSPPTRHLDAWCTVESVPRCCPAPSTTPAQAPTPTTLNPLLVGGDNLWG